MAFNNNGGNRRTGGFSPSSPLDHLLAQSLMNHLHLRPPFLDTTSFLSNSLDDLPLPADLDSDADPDSDPDAPLAADHRRQLAREEAKLEREIIRIVHSGSAHDVLKPNSGQSVAVGDHNICVGVHEEPRSDYRVWEWHGHVMLFDEERGYDAEYIYGNYFERINDSKRPDDDDDGEEESEEEEEEGEKKEKVAANSGLRDLIDGSKDSIGSGGGRVLHRNSLNTSSAAAPTK